VIDNIVENPHEAKFRALKKSNAGFNRRVGQANGSGAFLRAAGFVEGAEAWGLTPSASAWETLTAAQRELQTVVATLPPPAPPAPVPGAMPGFPPMPGMGGGGLGGMDPNMLNR
jgi:hypothetical protein